ncbi:hypothetical protein CGLO_10135 [Colletotrichum gloeosporioides Cg-14]|uniref:Uncharacterized protein n=1 Tax=Colletotrichum gloeosporioides (strain Cg-14) TaxID=1237896 RepID=T0LQF8_COLGC|nr:hypothetical protein CGLO_10135 [Colletotrichum gloeosporioides Cg-14]
MSRLQVLGMTRLDNAGREPSEIQREDRSPRNRGSHLIRHQSRRRHHASPQQEQQREEDRVLSALAAECGLKLNPRDFPHLAPVLRKKLADQIRYMLKRAAHRGEIVNGVWATPVVPPTEAVSSTITSLEPPSLSRNIANAQNEGIIIDLLTQRFRSVM